MYCFTGFSKNGNLSNKIEFKDKFEYFVSICMKLISVASKKRKLWIELKMPEYK